jgi:catechol 2,3-dioxygenase-like lactoylglutathione lyase family enzyme
MPTLVGRIQHVALPFPGTAAAVAEARIFYGHLLGFAELEVPEVLGSEVLWFAVGDQELHLFAHPSAESAGRWHPCLEVDDLGALRSLLEDADVAIIDPVPALPGRLRFFARDPFGNPLEFSATDGLSPRPTPATRSK